MFVCCVFAVFGSVCDTKARRTPMELSGMMLLIRFWMKHSGEKMESLCHTWNDFRFFLMSMRDLVRNGVAPTSISLALCG